MKTKLLILTLLFTVITNSFAGQLYLQASGYDQGVPYETGTYDSVYISDYYSYVTVTFESSNVYGPGSFTFTDIVGGGPGGTAFWYCDSCGGPFSPIPTGPQTVVVGNVNQAYVGVNLEVYGVDTWATINY